MKYAIVNREKVEAFKGGVGKCPSCNSDLIAKCGEVNINHWAHKGIRNCDHWWENETEWHRAWKDHYPTNWQEVVHFDEQGEKHIADVKTDKGLVIEFQHSFLKSEERQSSIKFYANIVWVVDGTRRLNDKTSFFNSIETSRTLPLKNLPIFHVHFPDESRILKEWVGSGAPVFLDFQESERLWLIIQVSNLNAAYIIPIGRNNFIERTKTDSLSEVMDNLNQLVIEYNNYVLRQNQIASNQRSNQALFRPKPRRRRF